MIIVLINKFNAKLKHRFYYNSSHRNYLIHLFKYFSLCRSCMITLNIFEFLQSRFVFLYHVYSFIQEILTKPVIKMAVHQSAKFAFTEVSYREFHASHAGIMLRI